MEIVRKEPDLDIIDEAVNSFHNDNKAPKATTLDTDAAHKTSEFQDKEKSYLNEQHICNHQGSDILVLNGEANLEDAIVYNTNERIKIYDTIHDDTTQVHDGLIFDREKHKETDEYRCAAEEEWAARQRELQIQAEEVQRLKRKRKTEILRSLDIEKRQKQRLEEVRELQKKDEETINLKECIRAEVRIELDNLEMRFRDMTSLLRALGITVEGGSFPMPHEVNAAYKQALLRFHPDRASRSDIHEQVKSEERFKLISRLKEKLLP